MHSVLHWAAAPPEACRITLVVCLSFDYQLSQTTAGRGSVQKVSVPPVSERMKNFQFSVDLFKTAKTFHRLTKWPTAVYIDVEISLPAGQMVGSVTAVLSLRYILSCGFFFFLLKCLTSWHLADKMMGISLSWYSIVSGSQTGPLHVSLPSTLAEVNWSIPGVKLKCLLGQPFKIRLFISTSFLKLIRQWSLLTVSEPQSTFSVFPLNTITLSPHTLWQPASSGNQLTVSRPAAMWHIYMCHFHTCCRTRQLVKVLL